MKSSKDFINIVSSRIMNRHALAKEFERSSQVSIAHPMQLRVMVTNKCNARCIMCLQSSKVFNKTDHGRLKEDVTYELFMEQLGPHLPYAETCDVYGQGEVLLVKNELYNILEELKKNHVFSGIVTNGQLLTNDVIDKMRSLSLCKIVLSIDAVEKEMFEAIRANLNWDVIDANLRYLLSHETVPDLLINFVMMRRNIHHLTKLIKYIKSIHKNNTRIGFYFMFLDPREDDIEFFRKESFRPEDEVKLRRHFDETLKLCAEFNYGSQFQPFVKLKQTEEFFKAIDAANHDKDKAGKPESPANIKGFHLAPHFELDSGWYDLECDGEREFRWSSLSSRIKLNKKINSSDRLLAYIGNPVWSDERVLTVRGSKGEKSCKLIAGWHYYGFETDSIVDSNDVSVNIEVDKKLNVEKDTRDLGGMINTLRVVNLQEYKEFTSKNKVYLDKKEDKKEKKKEIKGFNFIKTLKKTFFDRSVEEPLDKEHVFARCSRPWDTYVLLQKGYGKVCCYDPVPFTDIVSRNCEPLKRLRSHINDPEKYSKFEACYLCPEKYMSCFGRFSDYSHIDLRLNISDTEEMRFPVLRGYWEEESVGGEKAIIAQRNESVYSDLVFRFDSDLTSVLNIGYLDNAKGEVSFYLLDKDGKRFIDHIFLNSSGDKKSCSIKIDPDLLQCKNEGKGQDVYIVLDTHKLKFYITDLYLKVVK
ncbi:MAG: radical SAM protein [Candidatus Omnitrophota bacterium]